MNGPEIRNLGYIPTKHSAVERPAIMSVGTQGQATYTSYPEFEHDLNSIACWFSAHAVRKADRIAIVAANHTAFIETMFAAMRVGAVPVPINVKLPADQIGNIVSDSGARVAFVDPGLKHAIPPTVRTIQFGDEFDRLKVEREGHCFAIDTDGEDIALQLYTSGSTGRPKGVLLSHAGQIWASEVLANARRIGPSSVTLIAAPLYHKNALVALKTSLWSGGSVVLLHDFTAEGYLNSTARFRCTHLSGVPTMYAMALAQRDLIDTLDLTSVRSVSVGSAPVTPEFLQDLERTFPHAVITTNYGLTEGGPVPFGSPASGRRPLGSVGCLLEGAEAMLKDGASDHVGVLWVRNPGVMRGYHNMPEQTAERLVAGWFNTGDIFRRDEEGFYYFVGRADDMFKCGGESVYPQEVVRLLEGHPDVLQAAVIARDHRLKGKVPWAFVVLNQGCRVGADELKRYALKHGPAYMHPREIIFVESLPLSGTNKIDGKSLAAMADEHELQRNAERQACSS